MKKSSLLLTLTLGIAALGFIPANADAQDYPKGPVSLVVGFDPGGNDDTSTRSLAPLLAKELGVPVVIDSRPGAGMQIALEYTWAKPHDGRTILWHNQQYLSALELSDPTLPYRSDQWVWLELLQNDPAVVVVRSDSPWKDMETLIKDMKARPGEITVGLLTGSVQRLGCKKLFNNLLGVTFREVPQQGGAPMRTSLVGGHLNMICTNASETYALGKDVKALAVFNANGTKILPDAVPVNDVLKAHGVSEKMPDLGSVRGIAVPKDFADNHPEDFKKLHAAYQKAVASPEYAAWKEKTGRKDITVNIPTAQANELIAEFNSFFVQNKEIFLNN